MVQDVSSRSSIRVAIVTNCLDLGGTTTFLCNLAGELVQRKIPVNVISFEKENPLASDFQRLNIPVFCENQQARIYEDRMTGVLRRLAEFKPTIVLANLGSESFETLRYLPEGVFRIGIVQSDDPGVYRGLPPYLPFLDALGAVSKKIETELKTIVSSQKTLVLYLPYGVPMPKVFSVRDENNAPLRILYLGRLEQEQKRVRLFPTILEQLKATGMPFSWTIAGEGSEKAFLEQNMKSSPAQTVHFAGRVSYANVPQLLTEHDIFFLASDYEGLPLSLLEAMGCGLVPVVTDLPSGISEVIDETTGKKVAPQETADYAKAIFWLHEHRSEMGRMSQAAHEKVKMEFSVTAMTDRWLELFSRAETVDVSWPSRWTIHPILNVKGSLYFSRPMRALRRLRKKWQRV